MDVFIINHDNIKNNQYILKRILGDNLGIYINYQTTLQNLENFYNIDKDRVKKFIITTIMLLPATVFDDIMFEYGLNEKIINTQYKLITSHMYNNHEDELDEIAEYIRLNSPKEIQQGRDLVKLLDRYILSKCDTSNSNTITLIFKLLDTYLLYLPKKVAYKVFNKMVKNCDISTNITIMDKVNELINDKNDELFTIRDLVPVYILVYIMAQLFEITTILYVGDVKLKSTFRGNDSIIAYDISKNEIVF